MFNLIASDGSSCVEDFWIFWATHVQNIRVDGAEWPSQQDTVTKPLSNYWNGITRWVSHDHPQLKATTVSLFLPTPSGNPTQLWKRAHLRMFYLWTMLLYIAPRVNIVGKIHFRILMFCRFPWSLHHPEPLAVPSPSVVICPPLQLFGPNGPGWRHFKVAQK